MVILLMGFLSLPAFAQTQKEPEALGLPGDNLDLTAVLDIFQKSKTIEAFEKSLNDEKLKINNLDLNNDKKIDFIKVTTKKAGDNYTIILQDDVSKTETQDVAVILVTKGADKKVNIQIVGDEDLYGKNYVVEPTQTLSNASTVNPAYKGADTVVVKQQATTTVVVQEPPVVVYLYSPAYVPYYPPYYYGYPPPYFRPWAPIAFGIYYSNHYNHYHGHGHYHNTTVIHNTNNFNNYNGGRNSSNTVRNNMDNGRYNGTYEGKNYNKPGGAGVNNNMAGSNRGNSGVNNNMSGGNRGNTGANNNMSGSNNRGNTGVNNNMSGSNNRGGTGVNNNMSNAGGAGQRSASPSAGSMESGRTRSGGGGGGYSGGGGYGGGGGGMSRGGGGGRGR